MYVRQRALVIRMLRNNGLNSRIPFDIDALVNELDQLVSKVYAILHSSLVFQAPAALKSKIKSHFESGVPRFRALSSVA